MPAVRSVGFAGDTAQACHAAGQADHTILRPGRNIWRIERAERAAVLIDGAAFFAAVRAAFLKATRSILIVGWDIDSRTRLVGDNGRPADGYPSDFAAFLGELVRRRPGLHIDLLLWDYSLLYAGERELLPRLSLDWTMPQHIRLCLDDTVPFGSSQHQKIIVVDDTLAFSGGLDLTVRRWDTSEHKATNQARVDPAGRPYRPFHDVQMMVDGAAARALAELARQRWCRAYGGEPALEAGADVWPEEVMPDFSAVDVAIARTQPHYDGLEGVREVEALFVDSIGAARRSIYIENQFLSSPLIAQRLVRQLRRHPELEVVIVAPRTHDSWVERRTMRNGRIRFWLKVCAAGGDRVRLVYPAVEHAGKATDTMIHSKVMAIDDRFLRVGSANLNNRSMGADTECDLAIEARSASERAAVLEIRNRLLGEHCGASATEVAEALERHGSLVRVADTLSANGHSLRPIEDGKPDVSRISRLVEQLADPMRPVPLKRLARRMVRPGRTALIVAGLVLAVLGITLVWRFTGLADIATPERIGRLLAAARGEPWAPALAVAAFLMAGAVAFPINILVLATAAAFGPWLGALYSAIGSLASALIMYFVGAHFGQARLMRLLGQRALRALEAVRRRGVLAVVTFRVIPVAPFTVVNLAAGASAIRFADFVLGSLIGMVPGLTLLSIMGDRIVAIASDPTIEEIAILALAIVGYVALAFGAQALLSRRGGHRR